MYDRYNASLKWDDLKNLTQAQVYAKMNEVNEWDKLWGSKVGGSYGVPFVMGYCNDTIGYLPASVAYEYNAGASRLVTGSYEAHITAGKQAGNSNSFAKEIIFDWHYFGLNAGWTI